MQDNKTLRVGLLGLGTVGTGVWKILHDNAALIEERAGRPIRITRILVRDISRKRDIDPALLTSNADDILKNPDIDLVVELIGGVQPTRAYLLQALENGKPVVTANKALLAECGEEIFGKAREKKCFVGFEASVAGGIPILQAIREGFSANRIQEIFGIINGTCNYILTEMTQRGASFEDVLREAQKAGYAEADPSFDVKGIDAAQKLALLTWLSFGVLPRKDIFVDGIEKVSSLDIDYARSLGYVIRLLAIARQQPSGLEVRVHPTMVPAAHPLARVEGVFNAVFLRGDAVGETMFYGRGAGMMPTASAVVSDILRSLHAPSGVPPFKNLPLLPIEELVSEYYLRFWVVDKPGVLAQIAGCLGDSNIGIASVYQREVCSGARVPVVVMTHETCEKNMREALEKIAKLEAVLDTPALIRVLKKI